MTLASARSRDSSPRASSAVDCRANGEAGATARERQHTHAHTHGEKHASIRLNTTEGDARHSWRVDYTGSASRCAHERARRMRAARRRPPVLFARRSRAFSSRDETRTERNGVDRVLDDADEIQKTNHHRRLTTTTTTTRAGAAETIIGRGWRRETRYARSTRRRAMRCATRRERRCARSGGEFQIIFSSTPRRRANDERGRDRDATRGRHIRDMQRKSRGR